MKIVQEQSERVDQIDQKKKSWNKTHEHKTRSDIFTRQGKA